LVPVDSPKLVYHQGSGVIETPEGVTVAFGWAGKGIGKNRPEVQNVKCIGPLPQGLYVVGVWEDHPRLGKMVTPLTQIEGETFDRGSFFIHGPSKDPLHYGQESMGCIVVPFTSRLKIREDLPEGSYLRVEA
jgi:hypothetical protein